MKGKVSRHIINKFFCCVLLLQMINLSINPADFREFRNGIATKPAPGNLNEIETLYELIAEGIFDNNIPDSEDNDTNSTFKFLDLFSSSPRPDELIVLMYPNKHFSYYQSRLSFIVSDPGGPPPKQS